MKNRKHIILVILISFFASHTFGQRSNELFSRLRAISNGGIDFFNIDGIEITSQNINSEFSKKNILKRFKKYLITENDLNTGDISIQNQHFKTIKSEQISPETIQKTSYYFIENKNKGITAITFANINKVNSEFEKEFISLIINDKIPKSIYEPIEIDSINFAGRKIALGKNCHWMGINNIQCPYYGQMSWSVHKTLESASQSITNQYHIIKAKKGGKIASEELVDVIFEGTEVKAQKVTYDFKGITSLLTKMSGGKYLTIYFVASATRNNFLSCVMSYWDNDSINKSGLPPLLEEVMMLKVPTPH